MNLLILGGTVFLGRHLVDAALAAGHQVTLFNRGLHGADLFPQVEKLRGDRDGGLDALAGRRWDAAIDTCGYLPRLVRASAELLAGSAAHYTFISSISVYRDLDQAPVDESSPVGVLADESVEEITGESYGPLKALCEQAAEAAMPGRVLHVRPGLIVGPYDPTDRFTYWVWRVAQGGEVLAPGRPQRRVELIDGRGHPTPRDARGTEHRGHAWCAQPRGCQNHCAADQVSHIGCFQARVATRCSRVFTYASASSTASCADKHDPERATSETTRS